MTPYLPQDRDRLGSQAPRGTTYRPSTATYPAIPNNESVAFFAWFKVTEPINASANDFFTWYVADIAVGLDQFYVYAGAGGVYVRTRTAGGIQTTTFILVPIGEHFLVGLIDRVNTRLRVWLDAVNVVDDALVRDPQWGGGVALVALDSIAGANLLTTFTNWRGVLMSFVAGSVPSLVQMTEWLKPMCNPEYPIHASLLTIAGTRRSDWRPGEGVYGTSTVTDNGPTAADLTWQGGIQVQQVRTRDRTPLRNPRRTFYSLKPGYTATTGAVGYGFAVQPVIARFVYGPPDGSSATYGCYLGAGAGNKGFYFRPWSNDGSTRIDVENSGPSYAFWLNNFYRYADKSDIWFVCNGTDVKMYLNGQQIDGRTLAAALDITGNISVTIDGSRCQVCRVAAWNPTSVPGTLLDEIRACVMNPEVDPPSLTNKRVDFPLHSGILTAAGSTQIPNQGLGGGILTLSAGRDTSCSIMYPGKDP